MPITPYYLINYLVLSTLPTNLQLPPTINLSTVDNIPSPLTTLDDNDDNDDLNFNSKAKEGSQTELYTIKTMFNPLKEQNVKVGYTGTRYQAAAALW